MRDKCEARVETTPGVRKLLIHGLSDRCAFLKINLIFFEIVWGGAGHDCLTLLWGLWPDNLVCNHYYKGNNGV
ncbi:MAG: hypothetical protein EBW61_10105 [Rhodobacteraceae bacterium]|nr:hypothetical protein [Paracoccaceae bacterium]